jgi:hypothetical protein
MGGLRLTDKTDPQDTEGKSKWAPGQMADGSISIFTPDEAAKLMGERDADEEAFNDVMGFGTEEEVDLNSMSEEELDDLIAGLDTESEAA